MALSKSVQAGATDLGDQDLIKAVGRHVAAGRGSCRRGGDHRRPEATHGDARKLSSSVPTNSAGLKWRRPRQTLSLSNFNLRLPDHNLIKKRRSSEEYRR